MLITNVAHTQANLFKPKNWHYEIEVKMLITLVTSAWYVSGTYPNPYYYYYYISFDFSLFSLFLVVIHVWGCDILVTMMLLYLLANYKLHFLFLSCFFF